MLSGIPTKSPNHCFSSGFNDGGLVNHIENVSNKISSFATMHTNTKCAQFESKIELDLKNTAQLSSLFPAAWNDHSMDMCLFEAYLVHGDNWSAVADYMHQVSECVSSQEDCQRRWKECIMPILRSSNHAPWSTIDKTRCDKLPTNSLVDGDSVSSSHPNLLTIEDCTGPTQHNVSLRDTVEGWADRPYTTSRGADEALDLKLSSQSHPHTCSSSTHNPVTAATSVTQKRGRGRPRKIVEPLILGGCVVSGGDPSPPLRARQSAISKKRKQSTDSGSDDNEDDLFDSCEEDRQKQTGGVKTWSEAQVLRLVEAVEIYGHQWTAVSMHVGDGKTGEQCRMRNRVRVDSLTSGTRGQMTAKRERVVNKQTDRRFNHNKHLPAKGSSHDSDSRSRTSLPLRVKTRRFVQSDESSGDEDDEEMSLPYSRTASMASASSEGEEKKEMTIDGFQRRTIW